ncbi:hypothetical protein, partial [Porphyromonas macacae]
MGKSFDDSPRMKELHRYSKASSTQLFPLLISSGPYFASRSGLLAARWGGELYLPAFRLTLRFDLFPARWGGELYLPAFRLTLRSGLFPARWGRSFTSQLFASPFASVCLSPDGVEA